MGRHTLEYPKEPTNLIKRYGDRGSYALEHIHTLVNASQLVQVSFNPPDSPFPVIIPMIGHMGSFDRPSASLGDPLDLYIHGYVSSRMMNISRKEGETESKGMPVCVSVSHVDGLVLSLSAFNSSYNYRSAILFGHATLVQDPEEKLYALELITNSVVPDRWRNSRLPPTGAELQSTSVLRVKIASGSAKYREGNTNDDKHDRENEQAVDTIWTGVLPVHQTFAEPVPSAYNKVELPEYVKEYVKEFNQDGKEHSVAVAKKNYK